MYKYWIYSTTALVESGYHPDNCYHNCTHAADVAQALHCLLMEPKVRNSRVVVRELSYYSNSTCVTSVTCALSRVLSISCFVYNVQCTMYVHIMAMCCTCTSSYTHVLSVYVFLLCSCTDIRLHWNYLLCLLLRSAMTLITQVSCTLITLISLTLVWLVTVYWAAIVAHLVVHLFRTQSFKVLELKRVPLYVVFVCSTCKHTCIHVHTRNQQLPLLPSGVNQSFLLNTSSYLASIHGVSTL